MTLEELNKLGKVAIRRGARCTKARLTISSGTTTTSIESANSLHTIAGALDDLALRVEKELPTLRKLKLCPTETS